MYGISGTSGKHPCLWCHITIDALCVPRITRLGVYKLRTLQTLHENYVEFEGCYRSHLSKAKFVFNVIDKIYFDIPLEQVCIPGLHITLGVFMKFLKHFELFAKDMDLKMAHILAAQFHEENNIMILFKLFAG